MEDHTAEDDASLMGSIWGWRRASCTCKTIPLTLLPCISAIARSADSGLAKETNPRLQTKDVTYYTGIYIKYSDSPLFNFHRNVDYGAVVIECFLEEIFGNLVARNEYSISCTRFFWLCRI